MSKQDTVVEQKKLFLQTNKQLLSRGIPPSERLRTIAENGGIELSVLKGVMDKVNRDLKAHARKVYSRQMLEHVVEQIDELYWTSSTQLADAEEQDEPETPPEDLDSITMLHQSDDLTLDANIAKLPLTFPASSSTPSRVSQDDYLTAVSRLQALSAQRQTLQNRLATYRTLLTLLEPYRNPKENIQPNLVWKDAPLASELAKTRSLAIRVAGRVEEKWGDVQVPATAEEDEEMVVEGNGKEKVNAVLANW